MFFVNSGVIIIEVGGKAVASLREGSYFGELGLMFAGITTYISFTLQIHPTFKTKILLFLSCNRYVCDRW